MIGLKKIHFAQPYDELLISRLTPSSIILKDALLHLFVNSMVNAHEVHSGNEEAETFKQESCHQEAKVYFWQESYTDFEDKED